MVDKIKYYMWGFQRHYRWNLEFYAKKVFKELSNELVPSVFLLGILRENTPSNPICIEPEECGISVSAFEKVDELAKGIHDKDPRKNTMHIGPAHVHENYHENLKTECLVKAVRQIVDSRFKDKTSFVSRPVRVNKYDVLVVFQFNKSVYNKFNTLKGNGYGSLVEAAINVFLSKMIKPLYEPNQDRKSWSFFDEDVKDILRLAADNFIGTASYAGTGGHSGGKPSFNAAGFLFDIANYISSLKYEGGSSSGNLVIAKDKHPNVELEIRFGDTIPLESNRILRKILEISSKGLFLYTDGHHILGVGKFKGEYDSTKEDLFEIIFLGEQKWRFVHGKTVLMEVEDGNPSLPKPDLDKSKFYSTLRRIFQIDDSSIEKHWEMISWAIKKKHGALIIISKDAKKESERLKNQAILINPIKPNKETIKSIISIDGAVLFDECGYCHSIGVILDGKASNNTTPSRGARYNSAVTYIDNNKNKAIAVILSQDGMVDLYPDLMPQVRKKEILLKLEELKKESEKEKTDYDKYQPILNWFDEHKFYLQKDICEMLNKLKKELDKKKVTEISRAYLIIPDFEPNTEMDESYFFVTTTRN